MTEQEKRFFEKIEEASMENPIVRIGAAGDFITGLLKRAFTNEKGGTDANMWGYMAAVLTGVSVLVATKEVPDVIIADIIKDPRFMPMFKLETKKGNFWMGDKLNRLLCDGPISAWDAVILNYKNNGGDVTGLSPQKYVENNAKNMGKNIKLWNNQHNPYEEISSAKNTYGSVRKLLEPYKLEPTEYHMAFALALGKIIPVCEKVFPKELNCFDMAIETMMFVAHME